jgi:ABC-type multidrug transport system fused ATPase/permease subunit
MSDSGGAYNPTDWELTRRLLGYMKPFTLTFVGIVVTAFGRHGVYALIVPIIVMLIIDYILLPVPGGTHWFLELLRGLTGAQTQAGLLATLCLLIVALALIRGLFHVAHITLRATLSQNILRVMRRDFYRALIHKSFSYLDRVMSGQIISRVTSDMGAIDLFYSETVREIFRHGMQLLFTLYILYTVDPGLTIVCCVPLPVIFLFTRLYSSRVSGYLSKAKNQFGDLSNILVEGITGHKLIVTHGQESHIAERFRDENQGYVDTSLDAALIQSLYRPSSAAMLAAGLSLVVYYGGQRVVAGQLTVGEMVLFGIYFTQLVGPVRMFARLIMFYQDALASARRVFEVIDVGEDVPEAENAVELGDVRGEIVFDDVSFSYGGAETLTDINLRVAPSEKVALMGYVGSGKTTLAELVPRFYDVSAGKVTVDGVDVKKIKLDSLRRNVGIVLQDVYVFGDTIRNNIAFGRPDATAEEVERAAKAAQIHEFIAGLAEGYETMIGERGITLSGGQRQRLTIARALLTDPRVLILDDSTSNVDAETETLIRRAIDELLRGRTALIITQRASTCEAADRVVVMERGRVTAVGAHRELLRSSPDYRRLIESQAFQMGGEA